MGLASFSKYESVGLGALGLHMGAMNSFPLEVMTVRQGMERENAHYDLWRSPTSYLLCVFKA